MGVMVKEKRKEMEGEKKGKGRKRGGKGRQQHNSKVPMLHRALHHLEYWESAEVFQYSQAISQKKGKYA